MVMIQPSIFDVSKEATEVSTEATQAIAPQCRMCARPARWIATAQEWGMYCAGRSCSNRERICQACASTFVMNADGAGTKYCSVQCKAAGYRTAQAYAQQETCAWCGTSCERQKARRNKVWPFICDACLNPIRYVVQRLRNHHVPHERAHQLVTDPGCEVCGMNLLAVVTDPRTGKPTSPLVVDHDHRCCPAGSYSCGTCVRGLLCSNCNAAAGMLRDDPTFARNLASYLDRSA